MSDEDDRLQDETPQGEPSQALSPHDDEGNLKPDFVAAVERAVNDRDRDVLRTLGDLR